MVKSPRVFVVFCNEHGFFDESECFTDNVMKAKMFSTQCHAEEFRKAKYLSTAYTSTISILEWL